MLNKIQNFKFKNFSLSYIFSVCLEFCWLMVIFLLPICFSLNIASPWQIKYTFFIHLVQALVFLWLAKIILTPHGLKKENLYKLFPVFIFIIVLGLATIFSQWPRMSFWGTYERKMGYLTWLHCFLFFLVLFFNFKSRAQLKRIAWTIFFATTIVVVYGLFQLLGLDPILWIERPLITKRIFSLVGQPNFLASWLLLTLPFIIWLFFEEKKFIKIFPVSERLRAKRARVVQDGGRGKFIVISLIFISLILSLICFFFTGSRGGAIGLLAGLLFFFFSLSWLKRKRKNLIFSKFSPSQEGCERSERELSKLGGRGKFILLILSFIVSSVVFLNIKNPNSRFSFSGIKQAGEFRTTIWQQALSLIKKRPLLGYGPETQFFHFIKLYQPVQGILESINSYPDRSHNDFLDMALTSGIAGLLSYLFMIVAVFYYGFVYLFKTKRSFIKISPVTEGRSEATIGNPLGVQARGVGGNFDLILLVLSGLFAYLVSLQFSFHEITGLVYFWLMLVIVLKVNELKNQRINENENI